MGVIPERLKSKIGRAIFYARQPQVVDHILSNTPHGPWDPTTYRALGWRKTGIY